MKSPEQFWTAVQTLSQAETDVRRDIEDMGIGAYRPTYSQVIYRGSSGKRRQRGLFPGYVFALLTKDDDWGQINHLDGVIRVLSNCGEASKASQAEMDRMMLAQIRGEHDIYQPRAANGQFMSMARMQRQKKRRPRKSKRARNPRHIAPGEAA